MREATLNTAPGDTITALTSELHHLGVGVTLHRAPTGTAIEACRWSEQHNHDDHPQPATVGIYTRDHGTRNVCIRCGVHATRDAITDSGGYHERVTVEITQVEAATIVDAEPAHPGRVTVVDTDGRLATVETEGVDVWLKVFGQRVIDFDLSTPSGRAAVTSIRDALTRALTGAL